MTKLRFAVSLTACVALTACGSESAPQQQPPTQQTSAVAPSSPATPATSGPSDSQQQEFLSALKGIDADEVNKPDRAVTRGRNVCLDIQQGKESATVVNNTAQRFDVAQTKARKIVDAATKSLCPK